MCVEGMEGEKDVWVQRRRENDHAYRVCVERQGPPDKQHIHSIATLLCIDSLCIPAQGKRHVFECLVVSGCVLTELHLRYVGVESGYAWVDRQLAVQRLLLCCVWWWWAAVRISCKRRKSPMCTAPLVKKSALSPPAGRAL